MDFDEKPAAMDRPVQGSRSRSMVQTELGRVTRQGFAGSETMQVKSREIYASSNGDKWFLRHDLEADRVYVKHVANPRSGAHQTDYEIGQFLDGPRAPEREALLRLIGGLAE
jgi:hypothetical protein